MTLKEELKAEQVKHLDLTGFSKVPVGTAVAACVAQMRRDRSHVALVLNNKKLAGIVTERDMLRKVADEPTMLAQPVEAVMTADPVVVTPDTVAADALWLMDEKNFRNLPVVDNKGTVLGTMTHQSIIHYLAARYPQDILNRPPQPEKFPKKPEGG